MKYDEGNSLWIYSCVHDHDTNFSAETCLKNRSHHCDVILPFTDYSNSLPIPVVFIAENPLNLELIVWIGLHWYQHGQETEPGSM